MSMVTQTRVKDFLNKTKLEHFDYVINPYVGCVSKCLYCYASYMASFSKHKEPWGEFIDVKKTNKKINTFKIKNKHVLIGTVTEPYNIYEEKFEVTRDILKQLEPSDGIIEIVTKSKLVLRDIDILKNIKNVKVLLSICTTDENLREKIEPYSTTIEERIETLKILKENGIKTGVFIAPIIPHITDFKRIIEVTRNYTDEFWFDKLTLRGSSKTKILTFINKFYPSLINFYDIIYNKKDFEYFNEINLEISQYCIENNISFKNFFAGT